MIQTYMILTLIFCALVMAIIVMSVQKSIVSGLAAASKAKAKNGMQWCGAKAPQEFEKCCNEKTTKGYADPTCAARI